MSNSRKTQLVENRQVNAKKRNKQNKMNETEQSPFVDPRLQAREDMFQRLHVSIFETMSYVNRIHALVQKTGHDIDNENTDYLQLLRDYEVTKNLSPLENTPNADHCARTDRLIASKRQAHANIAQLCGAAITSLNLWRILNEIPEDLRDVDDVTKTLKEKYHANAQNWAFILDDLRE